MKTQIPYYSSKHNGLWWFNFNGKQYKATSLGSLIAIASKLKINIYPF